MLVCDEKTVSVPGMLHSIDAIRVSGIRYGDGADERNSSLLERSWRVPKGTFNRAPIYHVRGFVSREPWTAIDRQRCPIALRSCRPRSTIYSIKVTFSSFDAQNIQISVRSDTAAVPVFAPLAAASHDGDASDREHNFTRPPFN